MRHLTKPGGAFAALLLLMGCSAGSSAPEDTTDKIAPPATEAIAPGECRAPKSLAVIEIKTGGKTYTPTFGVGSSDCAGAVGDGFLVFDYAPILIEAGTQLDIMVKGDANSSITWPLPESLQPKGNGRWTATDLKPGCNRLIIDVSSRSGDSRATYGADIRVGGAGQVCLVRDAPTPVDPTDTVPLAELPPDTLPENSVVLPSLVNPPPITNGS